MTIITDKGERIKTTEEPHFNEFWQNWYVPGYRWIKSKQKFSGNCLLHSFKTFTREAA